MTLLHNYYESASIILFGIGLATLMLNKNLIKKIIGMNVMDTSVFLFLVSKGYIAGRNAPIITEQYEGVNAYINPIPSALILTGIVVAVSVTAFLLALTIKLYETYGTVDLEEIMKMKGDDHDDNSKLPFS